MQKTQPDRYVYWLAIIVLLVASLRPIREAVILQAPLEDAHITLTYARSIASGYGFRAFPTAEPSLGTTTPLNAMLLALLSKIFFFVPMQKVSIYTSVAFWVAAAWLWFAQGGRLGLTLLERFAVALLILVEVRTWAIMLGMEVWLLLALVTLAVMLYNTQKYAITGVLIGLAFLARPEGVLLLGVLCIDVLARYVFADKADRQPGETIRSIGLMAAGAFAVFLVWAVAGPLLAGGIIPTTISAKAAQSATWYPVPFWRVMLRYLARDWASLPVLAIGPVSATGWLLLGVAGGVYVLVKRRLVIPLLAWAGGYFVLYALFDAPYYIWYLLPVAYVVEVLAALCIAGGLPLLMDYVCTRLQRDPNPVFYRVSGAASLGVLAAVVVFGFTRYIPQQPYPAAYADYSALADWVNENVPEGESVAYVEIGFLQWLSEREVVDLLGLLTPEIIPALHEGDYGAAFEQSMPDYFVWVRHFDRFFVHIMRAEFFRTNYRPVDRVESVGRFPARYPFIIYERVPDAAIGQPPGDMTVIASAMKGCTGESQRYERLRQSPVLEITDLNQQLEGYEDLFIEVDLPADMTDALLAVDYQFAGQTDYPMEQRYYIPVTDGLNSYAFPVELLTPIGETGELSALRFQVLTAGKPAQSCDIDFEVVALTE